MKYRSGSKTSLFLIELIITIFFFSLASVVCIRLYLKAHQLSLRTSDQTHAVHMAADAAECFIAAHGDADTFRDLLLPVLTDDPAGKEPAAPIDIDTKAGSFSLFFDSTWLCRGAAASDALDKEAVFTISVRDDGIHALDILIRAQDGSDIYRLEVLDYP